MLGRQGDIDVIACMPSYPGRNRRARSVTATTKIPIVLVRVVLRSKGDWEAFELVAETTKQARFFTGEKVTEFNLAALTRKARASFKPIRYVTQWIIKLPFTCKTPPPHTQRSV